MGVNKATKSYDPLWVGLPILGQDTHRVDRVHAPSLLLDLAGMLSFCAIEVLRIGKFMEENIELLAFSVYFMLLCN